MGLLRCAKIVTSYSLTDNQELYYHTQQLVDFVKEGGSNKLNALKGKIKWIFTVLLFSIVAIAALLLNTPSASAKSMVYTDKNQIEFAIEPTIKDGTTLVQLRPLFESLGIELDWDDSTKTVTGTKGDITFNLTIGQDTATVNGKKIKLALPGRLASGHTLVPLRFVGEATGAVVGWHAATKTISVYSSEYMQIVGISREEAQKQADAGVTWDTNRSGNSLRGFYVHSSADLTGYKGCRGMCWDFLYFLNDHQLIKKAPEGGWDQANCSKDQCLSYEIKNEQLIIDGKTHPLQISDKSITVNKDLYFKHEPLNRLKLDGKYDASSYVGGTLGGGFSSTSTMIFKPDGRFFNDSWIGVISDGSDVSGDGSGVSFTITDESEATGRYTIINYSILLEFNNGTKEVYPFFRPDRNERMLKIGGRDFLIDDSYDPDAVTEPADNEEPAAPVEPYKDMLVIDNIAVKKNIHQELPDESEEEGGITITLKGYQWAELDISPDHRPSFNNVGEDTIIAFTAHYTIVNETLSDVDLSTLKSALWVYTGHLPESPALSPKVDTVLKAGKSVERLATFVVSADIVAEWEDPDLFFSELKTTTGEDVFDGYEIEFWIDNPYR